MAPAPTECKTLTLLRQDYVQAVAAVHRLQALSIQLTADRLRFQERMREARNRQRTAIDAIWAHSISHRCTTVA
jgi:hypothetical protein